MIIAFKSCEVSIVHPLQSYRAIVCLSEQQGSGTNLPALEAWLCFYKPCVTDAGGTCLKLLCTGASHATVSFFGSQLLSSLRNCLRPKGNHLATSRTAKFTDSLTWETTDRHTGLKRHQVWGAIPPPELTKEDEAVLQLRAQLAQFPPLLYPSYLVSCQELS